MKPWSEVCIIILLIPKGIVTLNFIKSPLKLQILFPQQVILSYNITIFRTKYKLGNVFMIER